MAKTAWRRGFAAMVLALIAMTTGVIATEAPASADPWRPMVLSAGYPYCLDADSNTWYRNPGKIQAWTCINDAPNQQWWAEWPDTHLETILTTIQTPGAPTGPAKCLDADSNTGWQVQTWSCNGQPNQKWYVTYRCDDHCGYLIYSLAYRNFLVPDGSYNGAPVPLSYTTSYLWGYRW